jgi:hypothetical protein
MIAPNARFDHSLLRLLPSISGEIKLKLKRRGEYEHLIDHRHYYPGFMVAGFRINTGPGLVDPYRTGNSRYPDNYLAVTESISLILATKFCNPVYLPREKERPGGLRGQMAGANQSRTHRPDLFSHETPGSHPLPPDGCLPHQQGRLLNSG